MKKNSGLAVIEGGWRMHYVKNAECGLWKFNEREISRGLKIILYLGINFHLNVINNFNCK